MTRPDKSSVTASAVRRFGFVLAIVAATGTTVAVAQEAPTLVPWTGDNSITVGSSLDFELIDWLRNACLERTAGDEIWLDGSGPRETRVTVELVKDYSSLSRTLNLEVDYKSKASASIAALKAGASLDLNTKYDTFAKDETHTLALVVKAQSDYGRKGLRGWQLATKYADLVKEGKLLELRQQCGTHIVVAQRNMSSAALVIELSDMTNSARNSFQQTYASSFDATVPIQAVTVTADSSTKASWKSLVESARRLSKVNTTFYSKGGGTIKDGLKAAVISNPSDVDGVMKALIEIGGSFTQETSSPSEYLVVSNTTLGLPLKKLDASRLETLNGYYLQLARVDNALRRIDAYKTFPALNSVYSASKPVQELRSYRVLLVNAIEVCVTNNDCSFKPKAELAIFFAEDIVLPETLKLECSYRRYDSGDGKINLNVLSYASTTLRGTARLTQFVSLPTAALQNIGRPEDSTRTIKATWPSFSMSTPSKDDPEGRARITGQLDYQVFHPDIEIRQGQVVIRNQAELEKLRDELLRSLYAIDIQRLDGTSVRNVVGPVYGGDCPLTRGTK